MRYLRVITALILALVWLPSTGHCLIAAAFPDNGSVCCACAHEEDGEHRESLPQGTCTQCVTLESGVNLASLIVPGIPVPIFFEESGLAKWMRRSLEIAAIEAASEPRVVPLWNPPAVRTVTLTKALPVRGPSPAA